MRGMTDEPVVFENVQIGKGLKPLAQQGFVVVEGGTLTLQRSDRSPIESASLSAVTAKPVRFTRGRTLAVEMNGTRYNVSPSWGQHSGGFVLPGDTADVISAAEALQRLIGNA